MTGTLRVRVPVGADAERWVTRAGCRRVLLVVHNVTSATRLLDVLPLLSGDPRVQWLATCTGSSPFLAGVPELLASAGLPVIPWKQAKDTPVDLAVSASFGGQLHALRGALAVLSHGVGYNKKLATPDNTDLRAVTRVAAARRSPPAAIVNGSTAHPQLAFPPDVIGKIGDPPAPGGTGAGAVLGGPSQGRVVGSAVRCSTGPAEPGARRVKRMATHAPAYSTATTRSSAW